jgi:protein TonB
VLFSALTTVRDSGATLTEAGHPLAGYAEFCTGLLTRAKSFYPETTLKCEGSVVPPQVPELRVGGAVQLAQLRKQVRPEYPPEARRRRMQGAVRFDATIGVDGLMKRVELISGPLIFYKESRDTVLRWEYNPTLLNGKPAAVHTVIDVNYALQH